MTEAEFLACQDILVLQRECLPRGDARRRLLYAAACLRCLWHMLPAHCRYGVETLERFADGSATLHELTEAFNTPYAPPKLTGKPPGYRQAFKTFGTASWWLHEATQASPATAETIRLCYYHVVAVSRCSAEALAKSMPCEDARATHLRLLRDIYGNPFRPVTVEPSWLVCNDSCVTRLARTAYATNAFDCLSVLADALEGAGCDNADILNHCRQPGEHVRGCWVVDLLLGKN